MLQVAILVPIKGRPHNIEPLLESIRTSSPTANTYFIPELNDPATPEIQRLGGRILFTSSANYATKINQAAKATVEPWVFTGADDLIFHLGWLEAASAKESTEIGVIGTNDLCNPRTIFGELSTHTLIARWYLDWGTIDEPGKIYHEGYPHELVDEELVETAKRRCSFAHATNSFVEHMHPMCGKAPMDPSYQYQNRRLQKGRLIFNSRKHLWLRSGGRRNQQYVR